MYTEIFDSIFNSSDGLVVIESVFDFIIYMIEQKDQKMAQTGQVYLSSFIKRNIGKISHPDLALDESEKNIWGVFTMAIKQAFWCTLPSELLNCKVPNEEGELSLVKETKPDFEVDNND